jgi:predicted MFS family arabinose efflux permease
MALTGAGWVFLINAASFGAVLLALLLVRVSELHPRTRAGKGRGGLAEGFRYVARRPDLRSVLLMFFLFGTFGLNFPIFISTMSVSVFHRGAGEYGLLTSTMAIGSVSGALLAARQVRPGIARLIGGAALFGVALGVAALMPSFALFGAALVGVGVAAQTVTNAATSVVQLSTEPAMRGRVMAILLAVALGGTPIGAPLVGKVADAFGPRWALAMGATAGVATALVGLVYLARHPKTRLQA